ncbi:hypothetical protein M4D54_11035 [Brachybacterium sp. p3-SID1565]|uniref:hypothetical protein n=1 Tax=Brachybacterium sp. p3-SID1565 TaxID=2916046 RepID=UPI0021A69FB1|nr:hypothetical protein [Brachybacterium sp. p3-SID1565]MCT1386148.1 hypothetical protein [Brachybacterium sp. p3-SID1565]
MGTYSRMQGVITDTSVVADQARLDPPGAALKLGQLLGAGRDLAVEEPAPAGGLLLAVHGSIHHHLAPGRVHWDTPGPDRSVSSRRGPAPARRSHGSWKA